MRVSHLAWEADLKQTQRSHYTSVGGQCGIAVLSSLLLTKSLVLQPNVWPNMTSADFLRPLGIPRLATCSPSIGVPGSPRVRHDTFTPQSPHIRVRPYRRAFVTISSLDQSNPPQMRFVYLDSGFCLRLPSDSKLPWTPLPSGYSYLLLR